MVDESGNPLKNVCVVVGPVGTRIRQRLADGTAEAREELAAALDSPRYAALLAALDTLVSAAPARVPGKRLRRLARKALRRADRWLDAADRPRPAHAGLRLPLPSDGDRDTALHEARKAYKRARYAVEVHQHGVVVIVVDHAVVVQPFQQ